MSQPHNGPHLPATLRSVANLPGDFYAQQRPPATEQQHSPSTAATFARGPSGSPLSQTPVTATRPGPSFGGNAPYSFSPSNPISVAPGPLRSAAPQHFPSRTPMEPYNPRQWTQSRQVSGSQMVFARMGNAAPSTREVTGMEGMRNVSLLEAPDDLYALNCMAPSVRSLRLRYGGNNA